MRVLIISRYTSVDNCLQTRPPLLAKLSAPFLKYTVSVREVRVTVAEGPPFMKAKS